MNIHFIQVKKCKNVREICKSEFKQNCDLNQHISIVHNENVPFRCNLYEKDLIHESPLNKHKSSVHERKKPYTCQDCNTCFYEKADLK